MIHDTPLTSKTLDNEVRVAYAHGGHTLGAMKNLLKVDLLENEHAFHFEADLPGIQKEHVDISVLGDLLTVTALRRRIHDEEQWKAHHRELEFGKVERVFRIPPNTNMAHTRAVFEDGILRVTIPKAFSETKKNDLQVLQFKSC